MTAEISMPLSFLAGVVSFLSPCVLPLLPSYVTFITGMTFEDLTASEDRKKVMLLTLKNSLVFILGFSTVFMALGASSSLLGQLLFKYQDAVRIAGGILVIIFGLFIAGFLKMDFLMKERKIHLQGRPAGYIGTFLIGMTFAAGWTPCIGPILGSILVVASTQGSAAKGTLLLAVYSAGLAVPFLLAALAFNSFLSYTKVINRYMKFIMIFSGVLLIAFGVLLLTNRVSDLTALFPDLGLDLQLPKKP
jgi:cytochrome c-type biogenesis protein